VSETIQIRGARLHNLKNINLSIPKNKLVVITGLSGSGKSTLAFDTLHKEGQRQYLESLGMVTYAFKPPFNSIQGLSPSISVDQHVRNRSPRSTVGTATEVYTYLRVLYARLGHRPCPNCGGMVPPPYESQSGSWEDELGGEPEDLESGENYPCPNCGSAIPEIGMANFSFNKPAGACPTCTGLGTVHTANLPRLIDEERSILDNAIYGWDIHYIKHHTKTLDNAARTYGFEFDPATAIKDLGPIQRDLLLYGVESQQFRAHYPDIEPPKTVAKGRFEGVVTNLLRRYADTTKDASYRQKMADLVIKQTCPDCRGTRLRKESRLVEVNGTPIVDIRSWPLTDLEKWLEQLPRNLSSQEMLIAEPILDDLQDRIQRLIDVGIGYLTLERDTPSLSAGEAQRLRLAALLGSGLTGVLYVLDEPTIGLHPRDHARLIGVMRQLRDLGNTVLVIEHDLEVIRAADHIIDFGPGAGRLGGQVVAEGRPDEVALQPGSVTGPYLSGQAEIPLPASRRKARAERLTIQGARAHNLRDIDVDLPLGKLVAVTGVSGSGKSSLLLDILDRSARQRFYSAGETPAEHDSIQGWEHIDKIITIDQTPIGRTPRSNAATYTDAFTPIRQAFAATPGAKAKGLRARDFSFNVPGGRCEKCQGAGVLTINMHFLPDVEVRCPACRGQRFKNEILEIRFKDANIAQVLDMSIEEALPLFESVPAANARLSLMAEVGLGYLTLGQPATTLSGGEAQRVKLAKELSRGGTGCTLYLLDEPTTGLHVADIERLLLILQRLVDLGNTVVVIEHNLDLIKSADWVIDLGPEGGAAGGEIIATGTPEAVSQVEGSYTGAALREVLKSGQEIH
jgi:excinuclease ABC subunit A